MDGRDAGHTRRTDAGPADPRTVWARNVDGARAADTPALADGRLYWPVDAVSDRARYRYRLHALDAATGAERWRVPLRAVPNGPPAVSGDRVVVSARRSLERGRVVAFRRRFGGEAWLHDVAARLTAPPTVAGGAVYVADWRGRVHALSVADGTVLWSRTPGTGGRTFAGPVAVHGGTLYLGSLSGTTGVVALDAATGAERWRASTGAVTDGPVVDDGLVAVRSHGLVVAFDRDGRRRWSFNVLADDPRPMALGERRVYVPARGRLHAIARDGTGAWTYEPADRLVGTPTVAGGTVLVRSEGRLAALGHRDGTERWTATADGVGRAVVAPRAAFLTGGNGRVLALGDT